MTQRAEHKILEVVDVINKDFPLAICHVEAITGLKKAEIEKAVRSLKKKGVDIRIKK